ncbi:phosphatidylinositol-3,5-bisphosphate 3-phosphatase MTMR14-like isoform X2 [Amphiura filiformis]|uniref:phosphatidylinositol-3,5-bisphosphate 3-phosphatase MTMR14-like isoform X2 n=1 Tax=Amphiura filiformis TaxID=82378 RepID=UPI003B21C8FC
MGEQQGLVSDEELSQLLDLFSRTPYRARDNSSKIETIERKCLALFAKDYRYSVIYNVNGELCGHYPGKLVILEYALVADQINEERVESLYDIAKLRDLMFKSRFARCRERFVVPVILYDGKHICRSATLSGGPEIYGRSGLDYFFSGGGSLGNDSASEEDLPPPRPPPSNEWPLFDRFRGQDIKLLKMLSVGCISDLMVENKKVKFGMNVSSSEKVDKEHRYADFSLLSVPYPGCEFFRDYRDNGFNAEGMQFDWSQDYVDADFSIPENIATSTGIDWKSYRGWDLVQLTQNLMKLFLHIVKEGDVGLLIHCISGWDRTPLFISLLRLTLWADGKAHTNLSASEILFLTVSYDWLLFGHNLSDRLGKGEDIFFFCFNFLKHITSEEFSVVKRSCCRGNRTVSRTDSETCMDAMVLLDIDEAKHQKLGSNSSLNSNISITSISSTSSPILIGTTEVYYDTRQEQHIGNGQPKCNGSAIPMDNFKSRPQMQRDNSPHCRQYTHPSTSPVAVPRPPRRPSADAAKSGSSTCGSWQLVSGTGSVKGYASARDSPLTVHSVSDVSSGSSGAGSSGIGGSLTTDNIPEDSQRKQRLDNVRIKFNKLYSSVIGPRYASLDQGGLVSGMIDSIACKVGLKGSRGTYV